MHEVVVCRSSLLGKRQAVGPIAPSGRQCGGYCEDQACIQRVSTAHPAKSVALLISISEMTIGLQPVHYEIFADALNVTLTSNKLSTESGESIA